MYKKLLIKWISLKLSFVGWKFIFRNKFQRLVVDKILGPRQAHLKAPYTDWSTTKDHQYKTIKYRYVYYWFGRKYYPFNRVHSKGIEIYNQGICKPETIEEYLAVMEKLDSQIKNLISTLKDANKDLSKLADKYVKTKFSA